MRIEEINPSRKFTVGTEDKVTIDHAANVYLNDNEQITLVNENGAEYDVTKKNWGYYATPSVNSRLKNQGFKTALVKNSLGQIYIMIVCQKKLSEFSKYLKEEKNVVIEWLDERSTELDSN